MNTPDIKDVALSIIIGYGLFFGSLMMYNIAKVTVPSEFIPSYFTTLTNNSLIVAITVAIVGLALSIIYSKIVLPILLTMTLAYFAPLAVPLSDGPVSLTRGSSFELGLFLFYAGGPMAVLILLTVWSWIDFVVKVRKLTNR